MSFHSRSLGFTFALGVAASLLAGCPRPKPSDAEDPKAPLPRDAGGVALDVALDAGAGLSLAEAVRKERWEDAERAFAELEKAAQDLPELRYLGAHIALRRARYNDALTRLEKLEEDLPLLSEGIEKKRAEASAHVGPFDRAGDFFARDGKPKNLLLAARAYEKAHANDRAVAAAGRVIVHDKHGKKDEIEARALRLRLAEDGAGTRAEDARWLAVYAISDDTRAPAVALLGKIEPNRPLTGKELIARASALSEAGATDAALEAVEQAENAKDPASALDRCRARADAYYRARSRYGEAALVYQQCSQIGGTHAAEDAFFAARSLARADRDPEAILLYGKVVERFPQSPQAEDARFQIARLAVLLGRYRDGIQAFAEYEKKHPNGKDKADARRYRAIALLGRGDVRDARRLFEELAGDAKDGQLSARYTNLAALAAYRDGDRTHAIARWSDVAKNRPLTYAALVARARLASVNAPIPQTIEPAETGEAPAPARADLPPPVDLLHRIGLDGEAEDALRAREHIVTAQASGRGREALCAAYGRLGRAKRLHTLSGEIPNGLLTTSPGPKNRWGWECAFPRPYRDLVESKEIEEKLPVGLVHAVMRQESAFDPEVVSPARAVGLLQLLPETAEQVAREAKIAHEEAQLTEPAHNIALGARYLHQLYDKLSPKTAGTGDPKVLPLVIGAYNAGPEALERWRSHASGLEIDGFVELIPYQETRGYVVRVLGNLARYGYLSKGEAGVPKLVLELGAD